MSQSVKTHLTPADIEAVIMGEQYFGHGTMTICIFTLKNGTKVIGRNFGAIDPSRQNWDEGRKQARLDAIEKVWELEGYLLREIRYNAKEQVNDLELDTIVVFQQQSNPGQTEVVEEKLKVPSFFIDEKPYFQGSQSDFVDEQNVDLPGRFVQVDQMTTPGINYGLAVYGQKSPWLNTSCNLTNFVRVGCKENINNTSIYAPAVDAILTIDLMEKYGIMTDSSEELAQAWISMDSLCASKHPALTVAVAMTALKFMSEDRVFVPDALVDMLLKKEERK